MCDVISKPVWDHYLDKAMEQVGSSVQIGSFIGALIFFILVTVLEIFKS